MKITLKILKFMFVFTVWTMFMLGITHFVLSLFWNFEIFSIKSWRIVVNFWNMGGNIHSWQDYVFFLILIAFIPCWMLGIKKGMTSDLTQIIIVPLTYFLNRGLDEAPASITIKNIDVLTHKTSKEEFIANIVDERMKKLDENAKVEEKTSSSMRQKLAEKK